MTVGLVGASVPPFRRSPFPPLHFLIFLQFFTVSTPALSLLPPFLCLRPSLRFHLASKLTLTLSDTNFARASLLHLHAVHPTQRLLSSSSTGVCESKCGTLEAGSGTPVVDANQSRRGARCGCCRDRLPRVTAFRE